MSPELIAKYDQAVKPFIGGAIDSEHTKLKSWRYFLEINSACQLKCPTCTKGNMGEINGLKYEHQTGLMDMAIMEKILDKIKAENPEAIVFLYGNSEPFLHPKLPECITAIKRRGLNAQLSTNLNHLQRVEETLEALPDYIIISLSGWTQEMYEKGHAGGDIEKVKRNMHTVSVANSTRTAKINMAVNYHVYNDNQHEIAPMKEYALSLGFGFFTSIARAISMENAIQYCRAHDPEATPFEVQEGRPDWNAVLPPMGDIYRKAMDRLMIPPTKAREMYKDVPLHEVCPVGAGSMFTFIRHDGGVQMCACTADRRITLGDYLTTSADQMIERRTGHSICKQCLKYRTNLYFHIVDHKDWTSPV